MNNEQQHTITQTVEENAVYAVINGRLTRLDSPSTGFGKQEIVWQNSKIVQNNVYFTQKL